MICSFFVNEYAGLHRTLMGDFDTAVAKPDTVIGESGTALTKSRPPF